MRTEEDTEISIESLMAGVEQLKKNISVGNDNIVQWNGDIDVLQAIIDEAREKGAKTEAELKAETATEVTPEAEVVVPEVVQA